MKRNQPGQYKTGALLWIASLQYYVVQLVVAATWQGTSNFSLANNTISDLGNTVCGSYGERFVCSPQHALMNLSFVVLGLTMTGGAFLLGRCVANGAVLRLGFTGLGLAGLGTIVVGLFPENTVAWLHAGGAALPFVIGNVSMVLIGLGLSTFPKWLRTYSIVSGLVGLVAIPIFVTGTTILLGNGGWERVVAYPQSIWMIITGTYLLRYRLPRRT